MESYGTRRAEHGKRLTSNVRTKVRFVELNLNQGDHHSANSPGDAGRRAPAPRGQEVEEDLADIEIERKKNIARNQEILRQLGLA